MAELNYIQNIVQFVKNMGGVRLNCVFLEWGNGWEVVVVIKLQGTVPIPHTSKFSLPLIQKQLKHFPLNKITTIPNFTLDPYNYSITTILTTVHIFWKRNLCSPEPLASS